MPRWLQLRHRLWELVQREFMFDSAIEISDALNALSAAVASMNVQNLMEKGSGSWIDTAIACLDPKPQNLIKTGLLSMDMKPFEFDEHMEKQCPGIHKNRLLDVFRDVEM